MSCNSCRGDSEPGTLIISATEPKMSLLVGDETSGENPHYVSLPRYPETLTDLTILKWSSGFCINLSRDLNIINKCQLEVLLTHIPVFVLEYKWRSCLPV